MFIAPVLAMNVRDDVAKLAGRDVVELFAGAIKMLVDLDGRLLHQAVGLLGAAGQQEVFAAGDPLVTILGVKSQPQ